jgi:5-methyltetrahydropteroyltriglutamate--homocysteine methyltransferase
MRIHNLGFPRIGKKRELKFVLENYWRGDNSKDALLDQCANLRRDNWQLQQQGGIDLLPVGDFSHYDHVLTTSLYLGILPQRFRQLGVSRWDKEFDIARGQQGKNCNDSGHGCAASDMTKWFNTNYHYIVPELTAELGIDVDISPLLAQLNEARNLGADAKVVLLGPLTYLWLGQFDGNKLTLLPQLLVGYQQIFDQLNKHKVKWLQIDEPILGLELSADWQQGFRTAYQGFRQGQLKFLLTSYFASVEHHLELIASLPLHGVHLDTLAEFIDIDNAIDILPKHWVISLGVINGRNIWRTDLAKLYQQLQSIHNRLAARLWLAPTCSLLHCPVDLGQEEQLPTELFKSLAFAKQKCQELAMLKQALLSGETQAIEAYSLVVQQRKHSALINNPQVQQRVRATQGQHFRQQPYEERKLQQQKALQLPVFPTTTIGSFPQTGDIRAIRAKWRRGELDGQTYEQLIRQEIAQVICQQEALELDVLVHGEPERNDMVEYFGELLDGIAISRFAWVQSYGSRCVKPPIIYGDVSRPHGMTLNWLSYAQSLTKKPVKGMLTGPITLLCWAFVRDDIPRSEVALQLALAVSDEVEELIEAGIKIIQIDEPAIREGMPLKQSQWQTYLEWSIAAFRLSCQKAPSDVQIHSHMCYSAFDDIMPAIVAMDADVLTIETSRSNMLLLDTFEQQAYPNDIGPGVYDIHSPNVPQVEWMVKLLRRASKIIAPERLWVNPDCGLKTRGWAETEVALRYMVEAAKVMRKELS